MILIKGDDFLGVIFSIILFTILLVVVLSINSSLKAQIWQLERRISELQNQANPNNQQQKPVAPPIQQQTYTPPQKTPITPTITTPQPIYQQPIKQQSTAPKQKGNLETVVGKNIIAWCAAILIFIGLISFGVLLYSTVTEAFKIATMFIISGVITTVGIILSVKKKNSFTVSLTGCGLGSLYISVLITHLHFEAINDITSFALLLVWLIGALVISRVIKASAISVIAHIGMAISICFAYAFGLAEDKIVLIIAYQVVSSIVLIVGNLLCSKKTYNAGLLVSFSLTVISSFYMHGFFRYEEYTNSFTILAFAIQFVTSCILTLLITFNLAKQENKDSSIVIQIISKIIFAISVLSNVFVTSCNFFENISEDKWNIDNLFIYPCLVCLGVFAIHFVITFILARVKKIGSAFENIGIIFSTIGTVFALLIILFSNLIADNEVFLSFIIIVSLISFILYFATKKNLYNIIGYVCLSLDALIAITMLYEVMAYDYNIILAFAYFFVLILVAIGNYLFISDRGKSENVFLRFFGYTVTYLSLCQIFELIDLDYSSEILLIILNILSILTVVLKYAKNSGVIKGLTHTVENIILSVDFFTLLAVGFTGKSFTATEEILYIIISLVSIGLVFARIIEYYKSKQKEALFLFFGIKATLLLLVSIHACTNVFNEQFTFSLVCMLIALLFIVTGFIIKIKSIRLYGLIVTLICVLKLAVIDISGEETIFRILALIGGGVICFAISALYSYMNKRLENTNTENILTK